MKNRYSCPIYNRQKSCAIFTPDTQINCFILTLKYKKMKTYPTKLFIASLVFSLSAASVSLASILSYDFNNLTAGQNLIGQDDWVSALGSGGSPVVRDYNTTIGSGLGLGQGFGSSDPVRSVARNFGNLGLTNGQTITLEFDYFSSSSTLGTAVFGVGADATAVVPAYFGNGFGGTNTGWMIRAQGQGTQYQALDSNGDRIAPIINNLYRVRSIWDLSANSGAGAAELWINNITAGTGWEQLFFDAGQTQSSVSLGITESASSFSSVYIRMPNASQFSQIDNLAVIPEPAHMATVIGLLGSLLVIFRRTRRT